MYGTPSTDEQRSLFQRVYGDTASHTEAELRSIIKNRLKNYIHEDIFYGVQLKDEPQYTQIAQTALMYKLIKEEFQNAKTELAQEGVVVKAKEPFIQVCLWAYHETAQQYFKDPSWSETGDAAYERYLRTYLDISGADNITMDEYPMLPHGVSAQHFNGLRILAKIAKEYGVTLGGVACSCQYLDGDGEPIVKKHDESDMYYQLNSYMMFRFTSVGYYTYWAKTSGQDTHPDGTSFINRDGTKNDLYYIMQDMHAEMQTLASWLQYYEYNDVKCYSDETIAYGHTLYQLNSRQAEIFDKVDISVRGGGAVATEMTGIYDENAYLYAVMNANPPLNDTGKDGGDIVVTLDFSGQGYTSVQIFLEGEFQTVSLQNGKTSVTLQAGAAAYVMPMA